MNRIDRWLNKCRIDLGTAPLRAPKRWAAWLSVDLSNVNRPRFAYEWVADNQWYASMTWGNGNSDPVWSIGIEVRTRPDC